MADDAEKEFQEHAGGGFDWRSETAASHDKADPEGAARRRGRPKGAQNRKTADFQTWYAAQGYKDPLQAQAEFLSADPVSIQAWMIEHEKTFKAIGKQLGRAVPALIDIVKEQMACARDLAPYLHGKAKIREDDPDERLPILVVNLGTNQLHQAQEIATARGLSIGQPLPANIKEINGLAIPSGESLKSGSLKGTESEE